MSSQFIIHHSILIHIPEKKLIFYLAFGLGVKNGLSTEDELFWILTVLLPIGVEWGAFHSNWCMRIISLGLSFGMKNVTIVPILPETRLTGTCDKYKKVFLVILQPYK